MTIVKHEIKQNFKTWLIWSVVLSGMLAMFMLLYPAIRSQVKEMAEFYANMGSFTAMFGMDRIDFTTATGFYGIEAGAVISIGGSLFAAMIGIAALSKEEGGHTAEFLLTHPIRRTQVVAEKLLSIVLQILFLNLLCYVFALVGFAMVGEALEWKSMTLYHSAQLLMQLEIGCVCLAISAFQKRASTGMGLGIAAMLYFLSLYVNASKDVEFLKYITPFQYADAANIFSEGRLDGILMGIGLAVTLISIAVAFIQYNRKDCAA